MLRFLLLIPLCHFSLCVNAQNDQSDLRPNILWITCEDISPNLGCYGDEYATTPNLDRLAAEGVLYTNGFASAPVCAVARSSIITGMYASSQGTQHMRCKARRPEGTKMYPELLRKAGYYCTNNSKTDYNFDMDPKSIWDDCSKTAHWRNRPDKSQPFFSIFNFTTSHESRVNRTDRYQDAIKDLTAEQLKKAGEVPLPPYYPDTKEVRALWARYYNIITAMDQEVGAVLKQLKEDGLENNTIIIFYSDHGAGIPRHKRWLYDSGIKVPWIVKTPDKLKHFSPNIAGSTTDELVSFIDLAPTALHLAGLPIPENMEGRAFLGSNLSPERNYVFAGRDRMDERYDMQRAVRDKRFKYIQYYEPYKAYCQYMNTPEGGAIMQAIRSAQSTGTLPKAGLQMMATQKPAEELFDCLADPNELNNLAQNPKYQQQLERMRAAHKQWSDDTKDTGLLPETILRAWENGYNASIHSIMRKQSIPVALIRSVAIDNLSIDSLETCLKHPNSAVRYWAAISLGNKKRGISTTAMSTALADTIPAVRIAAARALCKHQLPESALKVLQKDLSHPDEWVRLLAAQVLDEIEAQALSTLPALQEALKDKNKYVVRVANRAINELTGANNKVR